MAPEDLVVEPVTLAGHGVRLEPLDAAAHRAPLAVAIADGALWTIAETTVPHPDELDGFFADELAARQAGRELGFATIDARADDRVVGSTRFRMIEAPHRRVEIGFTFLAASAQRSHVNTAAKLLMLDHAFDGWGVNRVELLTDALNAQSRAAIERIGARPEGILRRHMVMRGGRIRDSVLYSIVRDEWPATRAALRARIPD